ncbi:hypothetical protein B0T09DRAFT_382068 [Sordaria sp. MPI-SDFR-AT-0083]|nr:hypothetical protein B0T09DRAFT_382068 [Sordaria sp. MPI-SDFR-AT-0083]
MPFDWEAHTQDPSIPRTEQLNRQKPTSMLKVYTATSSLLDDAEGIRTTRGLDEQEVEDGKLFLSPFDKKKVQKVLDIATGSGLWAIATCQLHEGPVDGGEALPVGWGYAEKLEKTGVDAAGFPETRAISQEQLVTEVKDIYAGLVMVESKCIEVDNAQNAEAGPGNKPINHEQWQALITLHRTLLHRGKGY